VATALGREYPFLQADVGRCARLFDEVRYGGRPATRDQAASVLALDDGLVVRR
jgi:hypothetical protein